MPLNNKIRKNFKSQKIQVHATNNLLPANSFFFWRLLHSTFETETTFETAPTSGSTADRNRHSTASGWPHFLWPKHNHFSASEVASLNRKRKQSSWQEEERRRRRRRSWRSCLAARSKFRGTPRSSRCRTCRWSPPCCSRWGRPVPNLRVYWYKFIQLL